VPCSTNREVISRSALIAMWRHVFNVPELWVSKTGQVPKKATDRHVENVPPQPTDRLRKNFPRLR
jgi:hypothetical protein